LIIILLFSLLMGLIITQKLPSIYDQFAIAALISRFFIYHAHYDNVILLFVVVALWKRITIANGNLKTVFVFSLLIFSLILPARFLEWSYPFYGLGLLFQLSIWLYAGYMILINSEKNFKNS